MQSAKMIIKFRKRKEYLKKKKEKKKVKSSQDQYNLTLDPTWKPDIKSHVNTDGSLPVIQDNDRTREETESGLWSQF